MTTIAYENSSGDVIKIGSIGNTHDNIYDYFSVFERELCYEHRESVVLTNEETVGIECLDDDELTAYCIIRKAWDSYSINQI
jgi:hypothetical protein